MSPANYRENEYDKLAVTLTGCRSLHGSFYMSTHCSLLLIAQVKQVVMKKNSFNTYSMCKGNICVCACESVCVYLKEIIFLTLWDFTAYIKTSTYLNLYCWSVKEWCVVVNWGCLCFSQSLFSVHTLIPHDQQFGKTAKLWIIKIGTNYH